MEKVNRIYRHELFKSTLAEIEKCEKNRIYCLHGLPHAIDTARIAYIMVLENNYNIKKETVYAAALLHDLGRYKQYTENIPHSAESARLAENILPDCGFKQEEIIEIINAISLHGNDDKNSGLAYILNKADKLSRMCMDCKAISTCKWKNDELNKEITY